MSSSQFLCLSLLFFLEGPHPIITSAEATPQDLPSLSGFQPPEVDGSPVDFPCSILPGGTEPPITAGQPDKARVTTPAPITMDRQPDKARVTTPAPITMDRQPDNARVTTPAPITMDQQPDNARQVTAVQKKPSAKSTPRKTTTKSTAPPIRRPPAVDVPIATPGSLLLYYLLANQNNRAAAGGSSSESDELYRSGLGRVWNQRNQQPHYPSHYPSYYQPHYPSYHPSQYPYQYPSHSLRQTAGSSSSSEEFGR